MTVLAHAHGGDLDAIQRTYGIPKEEVAPFLRLNFTDMPPEEIDSLTDSAYQHTDEFNTRKLRTIPIKNIRHSSRQSAPIPAQTPPISL